MHAIITSIMTWVKVHQFKHSKSHHEKGEDRLHIFWLCCSQQEAVTIKIFPVKKQGLAYIKGQQSVSKHDPISVSIYFLKSLTKIKTASFQ